MKALRNPEPLMKRPVTLLAVALMALSLGGVGCKHQPQKLTNIGGTGPGSIPDDTSRGPLGPGPIVPPSPGPETVKPIPTGTDIPFKADVRSNWIPNRSEFAAQTVYFDFDKSNIKPSEVAKLEEVVRRMKTMPNKALKVEGHCDERGTEEYNRALGDRRALSIREWLATHGLSPDVIDTISFGEDKPADPGHNEAAWKKNRRGELVLLSPPGSN